MKKIIILLLIGLCFFICGCNSANAVKNLNENTSKYLSEIRNVKVIESENLIIDDFMEKEDVFNFAKTGVLKTSTNQLDTTSNLDTYLYKIQKLSNNICYAVFYNEKLQDIKNLALDSLNKLISINSIIFSNNVSLTKDTNTAINQLNKDIKNNLIKINNNEKNINKNYKNIINYKNKYSKSLETLDSYYINLTNYLDENCVYLNSILNNINSININLFPYSENFINIINNKKNNDDYKPKNNDTNQNNNDFLDDITICNDKDSSNNNLQNLDDNQDLIILPNVREVILNEDKNENIPQENLINENGTQTNSDLLDKQNCLQNDYPLIRQNDVVAHTEEGNYSEIPICYYDNNSKKDCKIDNKQNKNTISSFKNIDTYEYAGRNLTDGFIGGIPVRNNGYYNGYGLGGLGYGGMGYGGLGYGNGYGNMGYGGYGIMPNYPMGYGGYGGLGMGYGGYGMGYGGFGMGYGMPWGNINTYFGAYRNIDTYRPMPSITDFVNANNIQNNNNSNNELITKK